MEEKRLGGGWIVFAGIVLILAGLNQFLTGLWALSASDDIEATFKDTLLFSDDNLDVHGWIHVIVGLVVAAAGVAVFRRAQWARWVGMIAASIGMLNAFMFLWNPNHWVSALVTVFMGIFVIGALATYGGKYDYEEVFDRVR